MKTERSGRFNKGNEEAGYIKKIKMSKEGKENENKGSYIKGFPRLYLESPPPICVPPRAGVLGVSQGESLMASVFCWLLLSCFTVR